MEDVLTELPPPSRFFEEDLNNFITPSPPLPSPFFQFPDLKTDSPLRPSLLIIALSPQSLYIFHHIKSKTLIGSLVIPENPSSTSSTRPSHGDKTCNIYSLSDNSIILVSVNCPVPAERCHSISKLLIGQNIVPERVLILSSVQSRNFRGRLSPDETFALKLETSSERLSGNLSLLKGLDYFPSGSMVDGLAAAVLARCEMKNIKGALCVSWPELGTSVVSLLKSLLQKNVLPNLDFSFSVGSREELRFGSVCDVLQNVLQIRETPDMDFVSSFWLREIDWEQESYPSYGDFAILPLFALFFPSVRFFLDRFVFEKVGTRLILGKCQRLADVKGDDRKKKILKFKESAWKCVYYLSAEVLAICVSYNEPWFTNTRYFWQGPGDQVWPDQKTKLKLKGLYLYTAGFYTYSVFALIFWETRRSDFGVSMSHHVATFILIVLSYIFRFARVGSVVLALHDASDVFLEVGKMSKYSGAEVIASSAFILFVLSWVILRLIYYPFWIIWSTSYEVLLELDQEKHPFDGPIYYYVFNSLLLCLLVLHIYWWVLMYRMLVKQILARGQLSDDVRSDSEGEDEHED